MNAETPTPISTPTPQNLERDFLKEINQYRESQSLNKLATDSEICSVAERYLNKQNWTGGINRNDYSDLCKNCNKIGVNQSASIPLEKVIDNWASTNNTKTNLMGKYTFGCAAIKNQKVIFVFGEKSPSGSSGNNTKTNATNTNNSTDIECIGPDGKQFNTTMDECKKLNEAWEKSVEYMINCNVSSNCGGGTKKIKKSECDNSTCCQIGNKWIFYTSKQKCKEDQGKNYSNNYIYPTLIPYSTLKPYPTYSPHVAPTAYATPTMTEQQAQAIIDQYNAEVKQCQSDVVAYYEPLIRGCNIQFGASSATEVCERTYEDQRQNAYDACGTLY